MRVLDEEKKYNLDKVIKAGYDTRLAAFEVLVPALINSYDNKILKSDTAYLQLKDVIAVLKKWNYRSTENSIATTLAITWGEKLLPLMDEIKYKGNQVEVAKYFAANATTDDLVKPMLAVINELKKNFGKWQVSWGEINRFQRISNDIEYKFDDSKSSMPVGFASATWGMLPSYSSRTYPGTKKRYGYHGNSFICAVEFGRSAGSGGQGPSDKRIKAKSLLAGGESGRTNSKHFFDQGLMYSKGQFKDVLFYKEDVLKHVERKYHPGE